MELAETDMWSSRAAGGIGRALAPALRTRSRAVTGPGRPRHAGRRKIAAQVGGLAVELDAGSERSVRDLVASPPPAPTVRSTSSSPTPAGPGEGGPEATDEAWDEAWRVNVMAHVWAARALLPEMLERGEGYLINTASAAGLLTQVSSLVYSVTKHAAVSWPSGCRSNTPNGASAISCICPQGVRTPMLELAMEDAAGAAALTAGGLIEPEDVADAVIDGIRAERMLILPHENVAGFMAFKGADPERWLKGMRRIVRDARDPRTEA